MTKPKVVTIDGPAGAGKSTVAGRVAERLGWRLLDTGAMYRAVALAALRSGIDLGDEKALKDLMARIRVTMPPGRVLLDDEDVSREIRGLEVTRVTRHAADSPSVRSRLVEWQREFSIAEGRIISEGRDQGTIVFPDAFLKFFLTASNEERAGRRHAELSARGVSISLEEVLRDVEIRDAQDEARTIAPMRPADDAHVFDCTGLDLEQVVDRIEREIRRAIEAAG